MTIIEAIKSGRAFRRKGWAPHWWPPETSAISTSDILADDWEVKPPEGHIHCFCVMSIPAGVCCRCGGPNKMGHAAWDHGFPVTHAGLRELCLACNPLNLVPPSKAREWTLLLDCAGRFVAIGSGAGSREGCASDQTLVRVREVLD